MRAEARGDERIRLLRVEPHRTRRVRAVAEDRESELEQFSGVAMKAPDGERGHARRLRLEHRQVAHARLVRTARVVDHEHVAGLRASESLEEHVDAPVVARRKNATRSPHPRRDGAKAGRR
jgi:hypothetical protein